MECRGKGRPTVVFVSGFPETAPKRGAKRSTHPNSRFCPRSPKPTGYAPTTVPELYLPVGEGPEDFEKSRSDPVPQPTTLHDGARDLHALLSASGERGPYVVVGHSLGGAISRQFATEYPQEVSGLVLIDYTPYDARKDLTAREWEIWSSVVGTPPEEALQIYPEHEQADNVANLELVLGADGVPAPLKPMPLIVLSADEPLGRNAIRSRTARSRRPRKRSSLASRSLTLLCDAQVRSREPGAGRQAHHRHRQRPLHTPGATPARDQPVREVVEAARKKSCALGVKNHGQCVKALNHAQR